MSSALPHLPAHHHAEPGTLARRLGHLGLVPFVAGAFSVEKGVVQAVPKTVGAGALWKQGLADYAGAVTNTTQVEVPAHGGGLKLRFNTGGLYTSVAMDGQPLGERAWAPFEWAVPEGLKGKTAGLKITVRTSAAPLFGL